jgi:hypothetical protein
MKDPGGAGTWWWVGGFSCWFASGRGSEGAEIGVWTEIGEVVGVGFT